MLFVVSKKNRPILRKCSSEILASCQIAYGPAASIWHIHLFYDHIWIIRFVDRCYHVRIALEVVHSRSQKKQKRRRVLIRADQYLVHNKGEHHYLDAFVAWSDLIGKA